MDELKKLVIPLLVWYRENKRDLPWRASPEQGPPDPYHVWVSEIMLQQTRVAAVVDYYRRFLARFPDIAALAAAPEDALMKCWQGLGYYTRARNLQKAAQVIMTDYGGRFPDAYAHLRALPGVGDYTAGAIASIAFSIPKAAVDGNVLRVVARLTGDSRDVTQPPVKRDVAAALERVMPTGMPGDFNQALMELGATVCLPNGAPLCDRCPARTFCRANQEGLTGSLPVKPPKRPRRVEERTVYLIFGDRGVLLHKRPKKGLLAGLWEFPNAIAPGPPPVPSLGALSPPTFASAARHIFTHVEWHMTAYVLHAPYPIPTLSPTPPLPEGWVWADRTALRDAYSLPSAFAPFLDIVSAHLREKGDHIHG